MIELVHMLAGAAIGSAVVNPVLAILLALLSHYLLDIIPHIEYTKITAKVGWKNIAKASVDFLIGAILVFILAKNQPIIYACVFFSTLPDIIFASKFFISNKTIDAHERFHDKIHFLENKKISIFWRIFSQIFVATISLLILIFRAG